MFEQEEMLDFGGKTLGKFPSNHVLADIFLGIRVWF
jgi:hypothetical protein